MPEQRPIPKLLSKITGVPKPVKGPNRRPPRFVSPRGRRLSAGAAFEAGRKKARNRRGVSTLQRLERFRASDIRTARFTPRQGRRLRAFISRKQANEAARTASLRLGVPASNFTIVKSGSFHTLFVTRP